MKYFTDQNGVPWTVFEDGSTNNPDNPNILDDRVEFLDRELTVSFEAKLYSSMVELAIDLEYPDQESDPDFVTLDEAIGENLRTVVDFRKQWLKSCVDEPECYPMRLPRDNAGSYHEQISNHLISTDE
ncbi:hypothetical protein [Vibrio crassostreae]|uniref:hypothetical protein n=1 Tax=Vibrio crassostreae TaxID=246167 RepID=UPI001B3023FF|nr:hypothetical protein [Vibrio crassostreae]